MARAAYQNHHGIGFNTPKSEKPKPIRLKMSPPRRTQLDDDAMFVPTVPKPQNRTILKLKTPLN